ncbi:isoliquiritigenin 2'-O-methyltransferase-like [Senna tora]|uniref:Isoliquiritigenin 2'-O-methyltransferase-like n=1 Tax=Senna tora TaxID=362788 RepID=A0A834TFD5_9FABA|nr:isoliquiritigenin 2'-O-methyltransferase-like [Senna tora]KAF7820060.1 isoliquiritigenin 2'-O-methyltransferase-like [Senna tora]
MGSYQEMDDQSVGDNHPFLIAYNMAMSMMVPAVLKAALELKIFDIMDKEAGNKKMMSPSQIASHLPVSPYPNLTLKLDRMLRLLASHSLLTCSLQTDEKGNSERIYGLSPAGKLFVLSDDGHNFATFNKMVNYPVVVNTWLNYKEAILDEGSDLFKKIHGTYSFYHYLETSDAELRRDFHISMTDLSVMQMEKVLEAYHGFEGISTLIDVGGSNGMCLNMIVSKYPSIKAINFDLPQVVQHAPSYPGIEHVGGDMLESVPKGADAIMLKYVCHNWEDSKCLQFLKNCYEALPEKGKVIVIDLITPEVPNSSTGSDHVSRLDNFMFFTPGGRERTLKDFQFLCKSSAFSSFHLASTFYSVYGVMEFHK